jgi:hypothetical protein
VRVGHPLGRRGRAREQPGPVFSFRGVRSPQGTFAHGRLVHVPLRRSVGASLQVFGSTQEGSSLCSVARFHRPVGTSAETRRLGQEFICIERHELPVLSWLGGGVPAPPGEPFLLATRVLFRHADEATKRRAPLEASGYFKGLSGILAWPRVSCPATPNGPSIAALIGSPARHFVDPRVQVRKYPVHVDPQGSLLCLYANPLAPAVAARGLGPR